MPLSAYEIARQKQMAKNRKLLESLGIIKAVEACKAACAPKPKHKKARKPRAKHKASASAQKRQRSRRLAGRAPKARRDLSADDFSRLNALLFTAMAWMFIPAHCFAVP